MLLGARMFRSDNSLYRLCYITVLFRTGKCCQMPSAVTTHPLKRWAPKRASQVPSYGVDADWILLNKLGFHGFPNEMMLDIDVLGTLVL